MPVPRFDTGSLAAQLAAEQGLEALSTGRPCLVRFVHLYFFQRNGGVLGLQSRALFVSWSKARELEEGMTRDERRSCSRVRPSAPASAVAERLFGRRDSFEQDAVLFSEAETGISRLTLRSCEASLFSWFSMTFLP